MRAFSNSLAVIGGFLLAASANAALLNGEKCTSDSECSLTGAVCSDDSETCCFDTSGDEDVRCESNLDCCGDTVCFAGICTDYIEVKLEEEDMVVVTEIHEDGYASSDYVTTAFILSKIGHEETPVRFELDDAGRLSEVSINGEIYYTANDSEISTNVPTTAVTTTPQRQLQATGEQIATCVAAAQAACVAVTNSVCAALAPTAVAGTLAHTLQTLIYTACQVLLNVVCIASTPIYLQICTITAGGDGDPHMKGLLGQKFDFSGKDMGWYAVLHDTQLAVNMRVTTPIPGLEVITYITGLGVSIQGTDGLVHTIEMIVDNPSDLQPECPEQSQPCLADGALTVKLDGVKMIAPGEVSLGGEVFFAAANIPGECRPFGFESYWRSKTQGQQVADSRHRLLSLAPTGLWILGDELKTNPDECREYVRESLSHDTLFQHQSEHASIQITAPDLSIRVNHGKVHQLAMRDPTDQYDLPDHVAYQMNVGFERVSTGPNPQGVIGETAHMAHDAAGNSIMNGPDAIRGEEEDYRVSGPLHTGFAF